MNQTPAGADRQNENQHTIDQDGTLLNTALSSSKKWIEGSGVLTGVNQLPQNLKDLGSRALDRVNGLSTTQKMVGGAILAAGISWLATRKKKSPSDSESSPYKYGRQRDAGSYGRRSYGYQAPDASSGRSPASGAANHADSASPYGSGGTRYGNDAGGGANQSNPNTRSGSSRSDSSTNSPDASANADYGTRTPTSHPKDDTSRSID